MDTAEFAQHSGGTGYHGHHVHPGVHDRGVVLRIYITPAVRLCARRWHAVPDVDEAGQLEPQRICEFVLGDLGIHRGHVADLHRLAHCFQRHNQPRHRRAHGHLRHQHRLRTVAPSRPA